MQLLDYWGIKYKVAHSIHKITIILKFGIQFNLLMENISIEAAVTTDNCRNYLIFLLDRKLSSNVRQI